MSFLLLLIIFRFVSLRLLEKIFLLIFLKGHRPAEKEALRKLHAACAQHRKLLLRLNSLCLKQCIVEEAAAEAAELAAQNK